MITKEAVEGVREAFDRVRAEKDLRGWRLDDRLGSPFVEESDSGKLTVSLLRGESEGASIMVDVAGLIGRAGGVTVSGAKDEIERSLRELGILAE